jgi:hypothetical protein
MPTFAEIREQIRQKAEAEDGKLCSAKEMTVLCSAIFALARGEVAHFFKGLRSEAEREEAHKGLALFQEEWGEEIRLARTEEDRLRAEARQQGLNDTEAEKRVELVFMRDFFQYNYREIREQVQWALSEVEDPPIPISEETLRRVCTMLCHLLWNPSGLTLRMQSTDPSLWGDEGEALLAYMRQHFAYHLDLLSMETTRLVAAAEARGMSENAVRRMVETRLSREFVGKRHRRRP